mmetsp:Transcript_3228/g.6975  ORF Transcript_3228/g.6975 Transcript_3228/m.6975 type:complete len:82 (-) Transcript_3228:278-523(-)
MFKEETLVTKSGSYLAMRGHLGKGLGKTAVDKKNNKKTPHGLCYYQVMNSNSEYCINQMETKPKKTVPSIGKHTLIAYIHV